MALEAIAAALVAALVLWLVFEPLIWPDRGAASYLEPEDPEETRRGLALLALKEIEFDRETGKLSEADFEHLKARYTTEALAALKAEEGMAPIAVEALIAARAQAHREGRAGQACPSCGPRPETDARYCSTCGRVLFTDGCVSCGAVLAPGTKFCADCGAKAA